MDTVTERYDIPGAAVAVVQDGQLIYKKYFGMADVEKGEAVTHRTRFKLHSLSKVFVATAIFQLIEKGELSLEDGIGEYMDGLPLAWKKVKIKHLLSHSSGLPDMIFFDAENEMEHKAKLFGQAIEFEPGAHFRYNQTNFWLLNRIIAKSRGKSLEDFLIDQQFNGSKDALVFSGDKERKRRAKEYFPNKEGVVEVKEYDIPEYMYGAAGIAITLDELIGWDGNMDQDKLLLPKTKEQMWESFSYKDGHDFAYGWGRDLVNGEPSVGFSGGTIVSLKKYRNQKLTVIVLTNGYKYFPDVNAMASFIGGLVLPKLIDENVVVREKLNHDFINKPLGEALVVYKQQLLKASAAIRFERIMNSIGYTLAGRGRQEDAIAVFHLNAKEHPESWNVWDSLGEGYEMAGDIGKARVYYKKSVALNPKNTHGLEKLKTLKEGV